MPEAREILLSAIDENRPIVLVLGQNAWAESEQGDPILESVLDVLGRTGELKRGWAALLDEPFPEDRYDWLAERFERRVKPPHIEVIGQIPWSAIFTSSLDPTLTRLFSDQGRTVETILTENEYARAARSRARPPFYFLFSRAGEKDPNALPPSNRIELTGRRSRHAIPLLNRLPDTATALGTIVFDGFLGEGDWLRFEDIVGSITGCNKGQVLWFGGRPGLQHDDEIIFADMENEGTIVTESKRLGTVLAELRALGQLSDVLPISSEDVGIVSIGEGRILETSAEGRLRVEAVASIVDDSWTAFLTPLGEDTNYEAFRRFHGVLGGPRLLVEGVRRGFAIDRDFEQDLFVRIADALSDHSRFDSPIVVEGQSGTGKSVALARLVARARLEMHSPVLYGIGRIPQPEEVSGFCEAAESAGAEATLIVVDANRPVDFYDELLSGLRSRGRRVVVVGSQYRTGEIEGNADYERIEAPATLSDSEKHKFVAMLSNFFEGPDPEQIRDHNFLAYLYRCLPASRTRIGSGLGAEARASEALLRQRVRQPRPIVVLTQLHQQLIEKGIISEYQPIFDDHQVDILQSGENPGGKIIDLVMVGGSLNCPVPLNLLIRSVTDERHRIDSDFASELFGNLDLFRWDSRDSQGDDLLVFPRLTLEASLISARRLGSAESEAARITELIALVRQGIDSGHERAFLLNLLQQIGRDGPRGNRYRRAYVDFARRLTELRQRFNVVDASLMLQESAFRRAAVREDQVDNDEKFTMLEEAREAVQTALDDIDSGNLRVQRRTYQSLLVERAALYGFLTNDLAERKEPAGDIWTAYQASRVAIRKAVSAADNYHPHDVGLWAPADLLRSANLPESQRAELTADIYSMLDQVEPEALPPNQRIRFLDRLQRVGTTLGDLQLSNSAFNDLEKLGSTAGYFLRAREYAPNLSNYDVDVDDVDDLENAQIAADYLTGLFDKIQQDERCLSLLLECRWIAEMGRRPLRGERQPLPVGDGITALLDIVHTLNSAAGESSQYRTRYLEGVLTWLSEDFPAARNIFRQLEHETDNVYRRRIFRRHLVSDANQTPRKFDGRIERQSGERRWRVRVHQFNQVIDLIDSDFSREELRYGREISEFGIAFNFIGPIADPLRH